jgi:hypothetical protein
MLKLKWKKADWQKDQLVGKKDWALQINDGPKQVADLLDKAHKLALTKAQQQKQLDALQAIMDILVDYNELLKNDREAQTIVEKRMSQVAKAAKRCGQQITYIFQKLKLQTVLDKTELRQALLAFTAKEHSSENVLFILALDEPKSDAYIIENFIGLDSKTPVNIPAGAEPEALNGNFEPARKGVWKVLDRDTMSRFCVSPELNDAVCNLSVIP